MDLRTEKEKARDQRNKAICAEYKKQREKNPEASRNKILSAIAVEYSLDAMTIRNILKLGNVY